MKEFLKKYDAPIAVFTPFAIWAGLVWVLYQIPFFHAF